MIPRVRRFFPILLAGALAILFTLCGPARAQSGATTSSIFPVAPHSDVDIEWWYLYAHLTTKSGRHLAVVTSFFRIGRAQAAGGDAGSKAKPLQQSHYLIYGVTDLSAATHRAFSLADRNSLNLIEQLSTLEIMRAPKDMAAQNLLALAEKDQFPQPTKLIPGTCHVSDIPAFAAVYGSAASLRAVAGRPNTYKLSIGSIKTAGLHLDLTFAGARPPMYVGGDGNTGIDEPDDMKYVSLTRCDVTGTIDTGRGADPVTNAQGWFDHQWGDSWTTASVGWDWWGIQLADGRDVLMYRLRRMDTGAIIASMATIEDASGRLTVARDVTFTPDPSSVWESPATKIQYPLDWKADIGNIELTIKPDVLDQEIPVLANKGAIWEGSVTVQASEDATGANGNTTNGPANITPGVGYQELVGYGAGGTPSTAP
jgi:predicted secreted hydrolase